MVYWNNQDSILMLRSVLDRDGIVLASGDTVLGLWGRLTQKSFENLNELKQRSGKPYLIVMSSADKLEHFTDQVLSEKLKTLIKTCWPGPVTLVFKARSDLAPWMVSENRTIALRVPDHVGLLKLLKHYNGLFSTSANVHTKGIPESISSVDQQLLDHVAMVCVDLEHDSYEQNPSTILDCSGGDIQVLRSGAFSIDTLLQSLIG